MNAPMPQHGNRNMAAATGNPKPQQAEEQKEGLWHYLKAPVIGGIILAVVLLLISLILNWIGGDMERHNNQVYHANPTHYQEGFNGFSGFLWQLFVLGMVIWFFIQVLRFWRSSK